MKKMLFFSVSLLVVLACNNKGSSNKSISTHNNSEIEIIKDNNFQTGFSLGPVDTKTVQQGGGHAKTYVDTLDFRNDRSAPVWRLAQWYSKYNLAHARPLDGPDGGIYYVNEGNSRKIALYPDNSLLLEVNASKEYDSPRVKGQMWPHLLIAQEFKNDSPIVGEAKQIIFSIDLKIEKCENRMSPETFDASLHTAQSPFYFNISNLNKNSSDYNHMIRFGIPSFDYRYPILSDEQKISAETGHSNFIYNVPPLSIWGDVNFQDKNWHKCEVDLKPLILRALKAMRVKDVFKNTTLDDLVITGMNFGWEIPGTFDATLRVKDISLKVIK